MNRLRAGEVYVQNPYVRRKVDRVELSPETVDCIAFWTKNPKPMFPYLKELKRMGYKYYFQVSLSDYGEDLEPFAPRKEEQIATFLLLSEMLGKDRVDWRFDPIIINETYTIDYHVEQFEMLCSWLKDATERCIFSFVNESRRGNVSGVEVEDMEEIARRIAPIAANYGISLYTCAEEINLSGYGIEHAACIDKERIEKMLGYKLDLKRAQGQKPFCRCVASIDVGMYDTCTLGCKYCNANACLESAQKKQQKHNPFSPIFIGELKGDEVITKKEAKSNKDNQLSLFDMLGVDPY